MLSVANKFALKWNLRFNSNKSQVMIIGKKLSNKKWALGDLLLNETNSYKYLGVVINRQLKDSTHINKHLADKSKKHQCYLRHSLANHLDINRVQFGSTLCQKAIIPSLTHAAGVWFGSASSNKQLSSSQYKLAQGVLKLKCKPSKLAMLN